MTYLNYILATTGITAITAMSLDRYFAIRYPFYYQQYGRKQGICIVNLAVWIQPIVIFSPLLIATNWAGCVGQFGIPSGVTWKNLPITYLVSLILLAFVIPGVILIFTNIYVFATARKQYLKCQKHRQQKNVANMQSNHSIQIPYSKHQVSKDVSSVHCTDSETTGSRNNELSESVSSSKDTELVQTNEVLNESKPTPFKKQLKWQNIQQEWKIAIMTVVLVLGFFITWLPFTLSRVLAVFLKHKPESSVDMYAAVFTTVNSVINPYLVLATRKDIRQVVLRKESISLPEHIFN